MQKASDVVTLLRNATELYADMCDKPADEKWPTLAKILAVWLDAVNMQLKYLKLREEGAVRKIKIFEDSEDGDLLGEWNVSLEDQPVIAEVERLLRKIQQRLSAH